MTLVVQVVQPIEYKKLWKEQKMENIYMIYFLFLHIYKKM